MRPPAQFSRYLKAFSVFPFMRQAEEEGEDDSQGKRKGPPPMWDEFMAEVYEKGKMKVPNTDPKSPYDKVTVNTLMKNDKRFKDHVYKTYQEWLKKQKDKPKSKGKGKSKKEEEGGKAKGKPEPSSSGQFRIEGASQERIDKLAEEIRSKLPPRKKEDVRSAYNLLVDNAGGNKEVYPLIESLSEEQLHLTQIMSQRRPPSGMEDFYRNSDAYDAIGKVSAFTRTVTAEGARQMMGALSKIGVPGSVPPYEEGRKEVETARNDGSNDEALVKSVRDMYERTQAILKALGIKELTLFRGMTSINDESIAEGDSIRVRSREVASTTADPALAAEFGRIVEYKVRAEDVFILPHFVRATKNYDEIEAMVLGLDDMEGTVKSGIRQSSLDDVGSTELMKEHESKGKSAASKVKTVEPTLQDDDWLRELRKKKKPKGKKKPSEKSK